MDNQCVTIVIPRNIYPRRKSRCIRRATCGEHCYQHTPEAIVARKRLTYAELKAELRQARKKIDTYEKSHKANMKRLNTMVDATEIAEATIERVRGLHRYTYPMVGEHDNMILQYVIKADELDKTLQEQDDG